MYLISQMIKDFKKLKYFSLSAISGILTQSFFAVFRIYILIAFIDTNVNNSPMTVPQTIVYISLTQICFSIIPWNVDWQEMDNVRTGKIVIDLIKPYELFNIIFLRTLSWRLTAFLSKGIPIGIIMVIVNSVLFSKFFNGNMLSLKNILFFVISFSLAVLLSSLITTILYGFALIYTSITNFIGIINSIAFVLSGMIIPLSFFSKELQFILRLQPFKQIVDTPALIFNGVYAGQEIIWSIVVQVTWLFILLIVGKIVYKHGENQLELNGG